MTSTKKRHSPLDLVAFGEVLWDIFQVGPDQFRREIGGAPANVCVHVARLGGAAAVVGAVGRDAFGDDLSARLAREGVLVDTLAHRSERTGIAFVLRTHDGQPRFLFYRQATADMAFEPRDLPKRLPAARYALVGSSTLVRPLLAQATFDFVTAAKRGGAQLILDLNVRSHLWPNARSVRTQVLPLLAQASLVKASADDLAALDVGPETSALAWVRKRAPGATLLVTRGSGPSSAMGPFGSVDAPAKRSRCVDATGAGDAFLAAVVRTLAASAGAPESERFATAIRLGNAMGARVVRSVGAVSADTRPLREVANRGLKVLRSASREGQAVSSRPSK